jgi:zinc D-Ala-D-Ala carboxypeptidase
MRITPHFTLHELTRGGGLERLGIDNLPPRHVLPSIAAVAREILEPVRAHFGARPLHINSGYRCPAYNALIGGVSSSLHVTGEAVDFEIPGVANVEIARAIVALGLPFHELALEFYSPTDPSAGWVHCAHRLGPRSNDREVLTIKRVATSAGSRTVTLAGLPPVA